MAELPPSLKLATVWLLVGTVLFLGIRWWQDEQRRPRVVAGGSAVEIRRAADGHYHWRGRIGGREVDFLVDTGATATAIPQRLAVELGLQPEGPVRSATAGGVATGFIARADIDLDGGVRARSLPLTVLPSLAGPLLGMDVLAKLRFTQHDGVLRLEPVGAAP